MFRILLTLLPPCRYIPSQAVQQKQGCRSYAFSIHPHPLVSLAGPSRRVGPLSPITPESTLRATIKVRCRESQMKSSERTKHLGRTWKTGVRSLLFALLFLISARLLYGQAGVGTILGTVTDNSGATIAKAHVSVTNVNTNITERTETTDAGTYSVPYLKPGIYRVTVESTGFQKAVVDTINLVVDQQYRVDVTLKPGQVSETVEVTANAVALDTETASVSQLVNI